MPLKIKIFLLQLLRDRLPSGTEVCKHNGPGDGIFPLCSVLETGSHILFSCTAARALWSFVRDTLGPDWEAGDLAEFLQARATQTGHKRHLFWLIFVGECSRNSKFSCVSPRSIYGETSNDGRRVHLHTLVDR